MHNVQELPHLARVPEQQDWAQDLGLGTSPKMHSPLSCHGYTTIAKENAVKSFYFITSGYFCK